MTAIDHKYAALGAPAGFHRHIRTFAINIAWRGLLASLAAAVLGIVPAGLAWAQDDGGRTCPPGTHCRHPPPVGKPCIGPCDPNAPPLHRIIVVDWRNNNSGGQKKSGHEDGTASNPFRTLRRAVSPVILSAANPGDTLSIRTGLYNTDEPLVLDKALHIRAENGPVTIYAHRMDDILTSTTDVPGNQPPAGDEQICQGGLYAQFGLVPNEWMQPPGGEALPALGLVVDKSDPDRDLRWDHPFYFDYWWSVAFYGDDNPYLSLLNKLTRSSTMDCSEQGISQKRGERDTCNARTTSQVETGRDPSGILHTEIEDRLLPFPYRPLPGDRVYMRGHRIVDCGHDPYGAEMHPPTLVVAARVSPDDGSLRTTVLAAPYLTTQSYAGKDFPTAVSAGIVAASASPIGLPKGLPLVADTSSRPFNVPIVAKYSVAVPPVPRRATALNLHYHFVTRPGVSVMVTPDQAGALRADVEIRMDPAAYQPFSDANCHKETVGLERLDEDWQKSKGTIRAAVYGIGGVVFPVPGLLITLSIGMQVAVCGDPNPPPGTPGTINDNTWVIDASQPYPVYGWLSYD